MGLILWVASADSWVWTGSGGSWIVGSFLYVASVAVLSPNWVCAGGLSITGIGTAGVACDPAPFDGVGVGEWTKAEAGTRLLGGSKANIDLQFFHAGSRFWISGGGAMIGAYVGRAGKRKTLSAEFWASNSDCGGQGRSLKLNDLGVGRAGPANNHCS